MKRTTYQIENDSYDPYDALCIEVVAQGFRDLIKLAKEYDYYHSNRILKPGDKFQLLGIGRKYVNKRWENAQYLHEIEDIAQINKFYVFINNSDLCVDSTIEYIAKHTPLFYERYGEYVKNKFTRKRHEENNGRD